METTVKKALVLFVVPLILYVAILGVMPLMEPDEARYFLIPQAMNAMQDYVTPHLKGVAYLEKPPLVYWITAALFRLCGENDLSARLLPGLCAWGGILLAYFMGCRLRDERTGLYSAAVLSTCLLYFALGRINILDMPLAFFLSCAMWSGFLFFTEKGKRSRTWIYLFYLFVGAAFLTKGLIGVVFPFAVLGLWLMCMQRWRDIPSLFSPVGLAILVVVTGPWLWLVSRANPDFLWFFFVHEHYLRYTTSIHVRNEPFYYFPLILTAGAFPWVAYLPQALRGRGNPFRDTDRETLWFLVIWSALIFLFFSVSSSKLASYLAPVFPPLAVLIGFILRRGADRPAGEERKAKAWLIQALPPLQAVVLAAAIFIPRFIPEYQRIGHPAILLFALLVLAQALIIVLPERVGRKVLDGPFLTVYLLSALYFALLLVPVGHYLTPGKSAYDVVQAMKKKLPPGEDLYQYRISLYGIDVYAGARTPFVDEIGELKFGVDRMPGEERRRWFPTAPEFAADVLGGAVRYCVTEGKWRVDDLNTLVPNGEILWDNGKFYLLRLKGAGQ